MKFPILLSVFFILFHSESLVYASEFVKSSPIVSTIEPLKGSSKITPIEVPIQPPKNSIPQSSTPARFLDEKKDHSMAKRRFTWWEKIKEAIADCIIGCILFMASFSILWFNERRAVETEKMIHEGLKNCEEIRADEVSDKMDGHLVYLSGECRNIDPLSDPDLGIEVQNGLKLVRKVECLQWIELKSEREERDVIGGGGNVYTDFSYRREWSESYHDSTNYNNGCKRNPAFYEWPTRSEKFLSDSAFIGKFQFTKRQLEQLNLTTPVQMKETDCLLKNLERFQSNYKVTIEENYIYMRKINSEDDVGAVRISFQYIPSQFVSLVAMQTGNTFEPFNIKKGGFAPKKLNIEEGEKNGLLGENNYEKVDISDSNCCCSCCICCTVCCGMCSLCDSICHAPEEIDWVYQGNLSKKDLFKKKINENSLITHTLRLFGFLCMCFGIYLIFAPVYEFLQVLPLLSYVGKFIGVVFALAVSIPLSFLVILLAWVFYRPILLILLILILGLIGGYIYYATTVVAAKGGTAAALLF